ncbi:MAG: amino acid permease [Parasporobacterium sp.]|nr:amino acid permease [Parasporobacterium sp.]
MRDNNKPLDRYLSPLDVWGMALGCMVGWGVFAMPGNTFLPVAGPAGTVIAMMIGMAIMLVIGLNFSYLMGRSSMTGGVYTYTKDAFGRDHAFLSAWFLCLSYLTIVFLNGIALFYVIRTLFDDVLKDAAHYTVAGNQIYVLETVVAVLALAGVGVLFIAAKAILQKLQTILAVVLFIGTVITAAACLPQALSHGVLADFGISGVNKGYAVYSIIVLAPWAFVGFEVTSFDTAHFRFPIAKSKRLIVLSIIAAAFAYVSMALVSVAAVPDGFSSWQEYIAGLGALKGVAAVPTFHAAKAIMGPVGLAIMTATAVAAILTGIIGGYRATTRVLSTMAEDRILSEKFSKTSYSILFIMVISILISFLGRNTLSWFVDLTSFGAIVGFGYTSAATWKTARTEGNKARVATGLIGTVISAAFVLVQLIPRLTAMDAMGSEAFLLLALWCLLGFIFYWRTVNHGTMTEYSGMSVSGIVLFTLVIYSSTMWFIKSLLAKDTAEEMKKTLIWGGALLLVIIFIGLMIMLYVQNLVRKKHEATERERIHAVERSLAKSQFLFNMSHDIRTPMNAIIGYTELAMKEPTTPQMREYLGKIDLSSKHLLSLINDILEMSRIESGAVELQPAPMDLYEVFDSVRDLFSEQMKQKDLAFSVHVSQVQNRYVWCDRNNLTRVLLNLISNAFKFTPSKGIINVSLWETGGGENGYGSYEIRVQDTGIGMSSEFAEKMFNAFERERTSTDSGTQGTGLGLSITKSIVDMMGGTIEVLTAPGSGTQMILRLKFRLAEESEVPKPQVEDDPDKEVDFSRKRVLLVEDNEINMEIACMILAQMGLQVETAQNGQIAVDMIAASEPGYYSAVLMDIQMPVMDGYTAARTIRKLDNKALADIPILAMTANAFQEDVQAAMDAGMQGHIAKPVDVAKLKEMLQHVIKD